MTTEATITELIAAAAVCAGDREVSRRLADAIALVYPALATDADEARRSGLAAARLAIGGDGRDLPPATTAVERVWRHLDAQHGPAITRASFDAMRAR